MLCIVRIFVRSVNDCAEYAHRSNIRATIARSTAIHGCMVILHLYIENLKLFSIGQENL